LTWQDKPHRIRSLFTRLPGRDVRNGEPGFIRVTGWLYLVAPVFFRK
jgi:hypothetical protein